MVIALKDSPFFAYFETPSWFSSPRECAEDAITQPSRAGNDRVSKVARDLFELLKEEENQHNNYISPLPCYDPHRKAYVLLRSGPFAEELSAVINAAIKLKIFFVEDKTQYIGMNRWERSDVEHAAKKLWRKPPSKKALQELIDAAMEDKCLHDRLKEGAVADGWEQLDWRLEEMAETRKWKKRSKKEMNAVRDAEDEEDA